MSSSSPISASIPEPGLEIALQYLSTLVDKVVDKSVDEQTISTIQLRISEAINVEEGDSVEKVTSLPRTLALCQVMAIIQLDFLEKIMTEERVKPLRDEFIGMLLNAHSKLGATTESGEKEELAEDLDLESVDTPDAVDQDDASSFAFDDYFVISTDSDPAVIITDAETQIEGSEVPTLDNGVEDQTKLLDKDSSEEDLDDGFTLIIGGKHVDENSSMDGETMSEDKWTEYVMVGK